MTRRELFIREQAALSAYKDNDIRRSVDYIMELLDRNEERKFYRFRPARQHEIDAIENAHIYLCRPKIYEDTGDCKWIDDLEALVEYDVKIRSEEKYRRYSCLFSPELYNQVAEQLKDNPEYIRIQNKVRNMCLIACITDKMNDFMWRNYAENYTGICLEYDVGDVLKAIRKEDLRFFPIRYVDDRNKVRDIQFGPNEYAEEVSEKRMRDKYILSCLTKNKVPYSNESEWRLLCENITIPDAENGKLYDFIRPSTIYLGKNISDNLWFEEGIRNIADKYKIPLIEQQ